MCAGTSKPATAIVQLSRHLVRHSGITPKPKIQRSFRTLNAKPFFPLPLQPSLEALDVWGVGFSQVKHGVSMLARDGQFHSPAAVWERGVLLTVATGFGDILEAKNILETKRGLGDARIYDIWYIIVHYTIMEYNTIRYSRI